MMWLSLDYFCNICHGRLQIGFIIFNPMSFPFLTFLSDELKNGYVYVNELIVGHVCATTACSKRRLITLIR